jgi:hypothetical protein
MIVAGTSCRKFSLVATHTHTHTHAHTHTHTHTHTHDTCTQAFAERYSILLPPEEQATLLAAAVGLKGEKQGALQGDALEVCVFMCMCV